MFSLFLTCRKGSKGSKKSSSSSSSTSDDDWSKPKKQKKNKAKADKPAAPVDQSIYKPIPEDDDEEEVKPKEVKPKAAPAPVAAKPKETKPAAKKQPEPEKKPIVDEQQAEIERLKKRLADMENNKPNKKASKAAEKPIANDDVYNPAPMMTKEALDAQRAEAERLEAENDASWQQVKSKPRPKKTKKTEEEAKAPKVDAIAKTYLEAHVPVDKRGLVMGKSAETLKRIVELTGAKIEMPKQESKATKVVIEGTAEEAQAAKQAIDELVTKGFSTLLNPELTQALIKVEADKRALVLGTKGANVQKIMEATGAKINFPERNSASDSVQIVGDAHGVAIAKGAIRSLLKEGFCHITHEGWTKITVPFPHAYRKNLIGQKGSVIKVIQNNTGCKLNLPEGDVDEVIIVGPAAKVYTAATQVAHIQEKLEAPVEDEIAEGFDDEMFEEEQW
jgi:rRNA processing protein Krr1/Pno1